MHLKVYFDFKNVQFFDIFKNTHTQVWRFQRLFFEILSRLEISVKWGMKSLNLKFEKF